jgi:UDP-N-acetyl-D-mannosaminuronate dehydrogenase
VRAAAKLALLPALIYLSAMRVLIVGCGYIGLPLGAELVRQGHEVFGLRRNPAAADELKSAGIHPLFADVTKLEELKKLPIFPPAPLPRYSLGCKW